MGRFNKNFIFYKVRKTCDQMINSKARNFVSKLSASTHDPLYKLKIGKMVANSFFSPRSGVWDIKSSVSNPGVRDFRPSRTPKLLFSTPEPIFKLRNHSALLCSNPRFQGFLNPGIWGFPEWLKIPDSRVFETPDP